VFIVRLDVIAESYDVFLAVLADACHDDTGLQVYLFLFVVLVVDVLHGLYLFLLD
jgi:hypothetical protein